MPIPAKAFCDTSFFYACLDARDINHLAALAALEAAEGTILCTTWDVISETLTLLRYRSGYRQAMAFWTDVCPSLHVVRYGDGVRVEAVEVFVGTVAIIVSLSATPSLLSWCPPSSDRYPALALIETFADSVSASCHKRGPAGSEAHCHFGTASVEGAVGAEATWIPRAPYSNHGVSPTA